MGLKQNLSLDTSSTIRRNIVNKLIVLFQRAPAVGDDEQGENVNQTPSFYYVGCFRGAVSKDRMEKSSKEKTDIAAIF